MITSFTPWSALLGGALIGLAASLMLLFNGRIAGISGIYKGVLHPTEGDFGWRVAFIVGLVVAGALVVVVSPELLHATTSRSVLTTGIAGVLVGVGVSMGNGCTSGHGVCGLSRFSRRSLVATLTFMATGMATATLVQLFFGGTL